MTKYNLHSPYFYREKQRPKRQSRDSLTLDITVVLIIKLIIIFLTWYAFFSEPLDARLTDQSVSTVFLGQPSQSN